VNSQRRLFLFLGIVFLVGWALLIPHVASHISTGDSAELSLAGSTLGIAHSPGYPVFVLFNRALKSLLPFGNEAFRQNLASLFFMAFSLSLMGLALVKMSHLQWTAFLPLFLLFSPLFRNSSYITEVFPLTLVWAISLFLCLLYFSRERRGFFLTAFLFGIGIAVHQTLILLLPGLLYFYWQGSGNQKIQILRDIPVALLFFGIGFSIQFFIPIRSMADPVLDWEDPETFSRFWGLITRERYGFLQLAQGNVVHRLSAETLWAPFVYMKTIFVHNLGWTGMGLLCVGTIASLAKRDNRRLAHVLWLMILLSGPFFLWLSNVHLYGQGAAILDRFLLLPLMLSSLLMGLGISLLWLSKISLYRWTMGLLIFGFVFEGVFRSPFPVKAEPIGSFQSSLTPSIESMRWDLSLREVGLNTLRHLPDKALLISDRADEMECALAYLKGVEGRRFSVRFVDANAGVSKSIYGDDYYKIWGRPRLRRRWEVEHALLQKSESPIFYATVDPTMIDIYRTPWGFLFRAWKLNQIKDPGGFLWPEILTWRFFPREERGIHFLRSLCNLVAMDLFDQNQIKAAQSVFGLAQVLGGEHRDVQMGYFYKKRGMNRHALKNYRRAYKGGVVSQALFSNLGALESRWGRASLASEILEKGIWHYPGSVDLLYNTSLVYWRMKKWKRAAEALERVLEVDPRHEEALRLLPKAKSLHRFSVAQKKFEKKPTVPLLAPVTKSTTTKVTEGKPTVEPLPEIDDKVKISSPSLSGPLEKESDEE